MNAFPYSNASDALAELKALSALIQTSIENIEAAVSKNKVEFPSLSTPLTLASESVRNIPEIAESISTLVPAALQIVSVARSPMVSMLAGAVQVGCPSFFQYAEL
jgi:hypothetical protein